MPIGIIAEGVVDQTVLSNLLDGLGFEGNILPIRPELAQDATDLAQKSSPNDREFGSWTHVVADCQSGAPFQDFFDNPIADEKWMIVQLDSDTCSEYGVQEVLSPREATDFQEIRDRIIAKINEWLGGKYTENLLYAICIRQMDAWVLTLYAQSGDKETGKIARPKDAVKQLPAFQKVKSLKRERDQYHALSEGFTQKKKLTAALAFNQSLSDFVASYRAVLVS